MVQNFRKVQQDPIQPFGIVIRTQVANFNKKKNVDFGNADDIELGAYFNFHNHTIYSSLQASSHLSDLVNQALENDFPAVGMVDFGNLMGAFKFISEVEKANGNLKKQYEEAKEDDPENTELQQKKLMPVLGC